MSKNSNKKFFGGLAVALLLPLSFYIIIKKMSEGKIKLPSYYGIGRVDSSVVSGKTVKDTVYHHVSDIVLTNQLGKQVSLNNDLKGKILIVDFFFTKCPDVCPKLTSNMLLLQKAFKKDTKSEINYDTTMRFISITVDPAHDSVPALRAYADRFNANHDRWWFLTGNRAAIYNYARNELHVTMQPGDGGAEDFIHSQKMVLIDQDRYIRGYYDGLDSLDLKRCADDVILLSLEKKKRK